MNVTPSQKIATANAIKKMAYYSAKECKGQRQKDAIAHCKKLGVDHTANTFESAIA